MYATINPNPQTTSFQCHACDPTAISPFQCAITPFIFFPSKSTTYYTKVNCAKCLQKKTATTATTSHHESRGQWRLACDFPALHEIYSTVAKYICPYCPKTLHTAKHVTECATGRNLPCPHQPLCSSGDANTRYTTEELAAHLQSPPFDCRIPIYKTCTNCCERYTSQPKHICDPSSSITNILQSLHTTSTTSLVSRYDILRRSRRHQLTF